YYLRLNGPPIRSDGVGYYLYLPAVFIEHDIGLQRVAAANFDGKIPEWTGVGIYPGTEHYLIKYPIGEAVLMAPFFFMACLASRIVGSKMDGFSFAFQSAAALAGLCYVTAGLSVLWQILRKHFRPNTVLLVLFGITFGTNLFHYATYDSIFSHAYSFFLFCAFLYLVERIYSRSSLRYFAAGGVVAGLILVTRPTNGLWLIFAVLYGVTSFEALRGRWRFWKNHFAQCLLSLILLSGVVSVQLLYWKLITAKFFVYTYRGEYFNFLRPEIINVLFSSRRGLFFWSPILLSILPGLFYIKKMAPKFWLPIVLYLPLNIYLISSWYCWWYGGSFGARAFVESLPVFAIGLCSLYEGIKTSIGKRIILLGVFSGVLLTGWRMAGYWLGTSVVR
ncbi:MAG: hypothetical protein WCG06_05085, partial [Candidatus Omnitrophota bacterium]